MKTLKDVLKLIQVMRDSLGQDEFRPTNEKELGYNLGALSSLETIEGFIRRELSNFQEDSE